MIGDAMAKSLKEEDLKRDDLALKVLRTPPQPHKPRSNGIVRSGADETEIVFSVLALESFASDPESKLSRGLTSERLEVSVRPYLGPAVPAFDDGVVGYVIRKNNGRTTFFALK